MTNRRRPILTVVEDTTPGVHDTTNAACDTHRYLQLGSTADEFWAADSIPKNAHSVSAMLEAIP